MGDLIERLAALGRAERLGRFLANKPHLGKGLFQAFADEGLRRKVGHGYRRFVALGQRLADHLFLHTAD